MSEIAKSTQLAASATTDYWRKPPSIDVSNAPKFTHKLHSRSFRSARVTVSAPWTRLYDQGGILILFPSSVGSKRCWLKAGIEYAGGRTNISVVAAREWADWSLAELQGESVTVEIEREAQDPVKGTGSSLFVYVVQDGKRAELPMREVTWAFEQEGEMEVGLYAARPTKSGDADDEEITVNFNGFELNSVQ